MYNSLQASLNHRFSHGFNVLFAYTYAHNLGMRMETWPATSRTLTSLNLNMDRSRLTSVTALLRVISTNCR